MGLRLLLCVGLSAVLWGCANRAQRAEGVASDFWEGRLALTVPEQGMQSSQNFSASFELSGRPEAGLMQIFGPFGQTVARLQWTPQSAQLLQSGSVQTFDSLPTLTTALTGQDLPIQALFDWLEGRPTEVSGWLVDLSAHAQGKILAKRLNPAAELKLLFTP